MNDSISQSDAQVVQLARLPGPKTHEHRCRQVKYGLLQDDLNKGDTMIHCRKR